MSSSIMDLEAVKVYKDEGNGLWMDEWMLLTSVCVFNGVKHFYAANGLFYREVLAQHDVGSCSISIDADDDGYYKCGTKEESDISSTFEENFGLKVEKSICISGVKEAPIEQQTSTTNQPTKRKGCKNN
uniref:Uncharacterized protein n=1 Tax=Glossina austeni TaxID=7395 RepID=A0A1A9VF09_GLOAU